jgi:hypothetical protein
MMNLHSNVPCFSKNLSPKHQVEILLVWCGALPQTFCRRKNTSKCGTPRTRASVEQTYGGARNYVVKSCGGRTNTSIETRFDNRKQRLGKRARTEECSERGNNHVGSMFGGSTPFGQMLQALEREASNMLDKRLSSGGRSW